MFGLCEEYGGGERAGVAAMMVKLDHGTTIHMGTGVLRRLVRRQNIFFC